VVKDWISRRRFLITVLVVIGLGLLALLGYFLDISSSKTTEKSAQDRQILMDTIVDVRVEGPNAVALMAEAFQVMARVEQKLSRFVDTSDVSRINRQAGEWVEVGEETLAVINLALEAARVSGGAFDVTIGAVMDAWGFGSDERKIPAEADLAEALATVDYTRVEVDEAAGRVRIPKGTILDLGGIAKGYAVDQAIQTLRQKGARSSIINAGGDIAAIGRRPDGNPWRVGVQDPDTPSEISWILLLDNRSVLTSGDYQRYFEADGKRWHHIIDPKTGYPAQGLRSVTVESETAGYGDAIATAVFVLGWEEGRRLVESLPGIEAIMVSEKETWLSPGLRNRTIAQ